jgi:hypothetical protein
MSIVKGILVGLLVLAITACSTPEQKKGDIPWNIVSWSQMYVWKVDTDVAAGTGFWVSNKRFVTACHVVSGQKIAELTQEESPIKIEATVESCDTDTDVAVLLRVGTSGPVFKKTKIQPIMPRQGARVYAPGHPLGMKLVISDGFYQYQTSDPNLTRIDTHIITPLTISGDSGSPVIGYEDGAVVIYGLRVAVRLIPMGQGVYQLITHLTLMSSGQNILNALIEE